MADIIVPNGAPSIGPGYFFVANLGVAKPSNTVEAGVFSDAWPAGWQCPGITAEGYTFTYELTTERVSAAEYFDPILTVPTGRDLGVAFALMNITDFAYDLSWGGAEIVTTGTGPTTKTTITPPDPGDEIYRQLGWQSQDGETRMFWEEGIQSGSVTWAAQKAPNFAQFALNFQVDQPAGDVKPMQVVLAGERRLLQAAA